MRYTGLFVLRYVQIKGFVIVKVALIPKLDVLLVSDSLDNYTYTFWKLFLLFYYRIDIGPK